MFGDRSAVALFLIVVDVSKYFDKPPTNSSGKNRKCPMSRSFSNLVRFIGNFRYYRRNGCDIKTAWHLAEMTLP